MVGDMLYYSTCNCNCSYFYYFFVFSLTSLSSFFLPVFLLCLYCSFRKFMMPHHFHFLKLFFFLIFSSFSLHPLLLVYTPTLLSSLFPPFIFLLFFIMYSSSTYLSQLAPPIYSFRMSWRDISSPSFPLHY